jgi:hypothetical protein
MPFRDATSPDWVIRWGTDYDLGWVEQALGLSPGSYDERQAGESLTFIEPHYGEQKHLSLYDFADRATGGVRKVVIGEISNNVWAIGYWKGAAA